MHCFWCSLASESLHLNEHEDALWLDCQHLDKVNWLPADSDIILSIRQELENI